MMVHIFRKLMHNNFNFKKKSILNLENIFTSNNIISVVQVVESSHLAGFSKSLKIKYSFIILPLKAYNKS